MKHVSVRDLKRLLSSLQLRICPGYDSFIKLILALAESNHSGNRTCFHHCAISVWRLCRVGSYPAEVFEVTLDTGCIGMMRMRSSLEWARNRQTLCFKFLSLDNKVGKEKKQGTHENT